MGQQYDVDGVVYEQGPDGKYHPVQSAPAASTPTTIPLPASPRQKAADILAGRTADRADRSEGRAAAASAQAQQLAHDKFVAELYAKGLRPGPDGTPVAIPGWTPPPGDLRKPGMALRQGDSDNLRKLSDNLANLQSLHDSFQTDFGGNPIGALENVAQGFSSSIGTDGQRQWWGNLAGVDNLIRNGQFGASLTAGEKAAYAKTTVSPGMDPKEITRNLNERVRIMQSAAGRYTTALKAGGWNKDEIDAFTGAQLEWKPPTDEVKPKGDGPLPSAMAMPRVVNGSGDGAAPAGSTTSNTPLPPGYQQAYEAFVRSGKFTPDQYAAFRGALDRTYYGDQAQDQSETYRTEADGILKQLQTPGSTLNLKVPGTEHKMTTGAFSEQARNDAVNNPVGAAVAGFTDMAMMGVPSMLAKDQMQALAEAQPAGMALGQVGGAMVGTSAVSSLGRKTLGRAFPKLMGEGKFAQVGRNLASDTGYGALYGQNANGDPVSGALQAAAGSAGGQAVGSIVGRGISGVTSSPTVGRLRDMGITPTIGQIFRGRAADNGGKSLVAGMEDVISNTGGAGTFVNSARNRALEGANTAGYNIGAQGQGQVTGVGEQALGQLENIKTDAYGRALDGVSMPANDSQFRQAFDEAGAQGLAVDAARNRGDFGYIMDKKLAPALGGGPEISGRQMQDGLRLLQGQSRAYNKAATGLAPDPAASGVADALDSVSGAITDLAGNYSPGTGDSLRQANSIYRNFKVLDHAAEAGRNEGGVWTGAQLGNAIKGNNASLGQRGFSAMSDSPFFQLQQDMQAVLPNKVPPTGVNAAPMLAMLGAATGAGGVATDNDWMKTVGALALLSTPYTKGGQKAAAMALLDRPESIRNLGLLMRRGKGLFGSAGAGSALAIGQN